MTMTNWTNPKTIVQGAAALSADWNTYIRDNTQHLKEQVEDAGNLPVVSTDDTGAPWNIPYIDGAPSGSLGNLTKDVAEAVALGLTSAGPEFQTADSNTVNLDFSTDKVITRTATGAVTFTGSNYTAAKSVTVRVVASGGNRNLSFPADWKFVSFKPASLANNKTGVLAVTCFSNNAADAVAAWAAEA